MKQSTKIVLAVAALLIVSLLIAAAATHGAERTVPCPDCGGTGVVDDAGCETCGGEGETAGEGAVIASWWALLPPIIAIGLALITKEVYSSLFIGIVSGCLLAGKFTLSGVFDKLTGDAFISAVADNAGIFVFLVELGVLVALVNKAGGSAAFGRWAQKHIKTKTGALLATFLLGVLIFIDDYFNCLTVGSVMRPVTDSKGISRSKLAYLIDATAAPICMIAPISSWAAAVSAYAEDGQGLRLFISAIPFNFYSLLTLVFVVGLAVLGFDYGKMRLHEQNAANGDLLSGKEQDAPEEEGVGNPRGRVLDLVLPVVLLIVFSVIALVYVGGMFDGASFVDAFADTDATVGLPMGGFAALAVTIIYLAARRVVSFKEAMQALPRGFIAMVPAITILTMATALKNITGLLGAKYFVADLMNSAAAGLSNFLPAIIFLVACVLSFATGTSWGTFGILIPIVTAIFPADAPLLVVGMSACLAGAVCGDHCSPISDTTIMSSAGARCEHINHVSTQLPYALTVAGVSFVMYLIAGFLPNAVVCLLIGAALTIGTLFLLRWLTNKKQTPAA